MSSVLVDMATGAVIHRSARLRPCTARAHRSSWLTRYRRWFDTDVPAPSAKRARRRTRRVHASRGSKPRLARHAVRWSEMRVACVANSLHRPIIMSTPIKKEIDDALSELETVADEIRVKIHLAGLDANDIWNKTLEPRLLIARQHACEAKAASKAAIASTLDAFREFQKRL